MLTRRNWLLRCSIIINLAVLVYIGTHIVIKNGGPLEYAYEPAAIIASPPGTVYPSSKDQIRAFILDKVSSNDVTTDLKVPKVDTNVTSPVVFNNPAQSEILYNEQQIDADDAVNSGGTSVTSSSSSTVVQDETVLDVATLENLRMLINCQDKSYEPLTRQRGEFWVLHNFVRADHGPIGCHETVTYTTHGDFTFLDNLVPLLEKWRNPVSLAIHAPGTDLTAAVNCIRYLRDCTNTDLVKMYTTFHVFFSTKHIPKQIPNMKKLLTEQYNCSLPAPYKVDPSTLYKTQKKLLYPVNVGRNVARESALTHYVLASDIELYPSPLLAERFLNMIARNRPPLNMTNPRVFPLSIFEVEGNQTVPNTKFELLDMLKKSLAIPFHKKVCAGCHNVPKSKEWMQANETNQLDIYHIGKRMGPFVHWEPIFIGTNTDPLYDERLSWEGKSDKMTQGYALCVMDYDFMILNNAFLVHRPGIKTLKKDDRRARLAAKTNQLIRRIIFPELKVLYGVKKGCAV